MPIRLIWLRIFCLFLAVCCVCQWKYAVMNNNRPVCPGKGKWDNKHTSVQFPGLCGDLNALSTKMKPKNDQLIYQKKDWSGAAYHQWWSSCSINDLKNNSYAAENVVNPSTICFSIPLEKASNIIMAGYPLQFQIINLQKSI